MTITKNEAISLMIIQKMAAGLTVRQAIDAVLGAGVSANLISDVYDTLRAAK